MMNWVTLVGRVMMSAIFIHGGIGKAMAPAATMATLARYNLPMPGAAYAVSLAVEIGVGIVFLIGWKARISAAILAFWCVATAYVAHYHPADQGQMIHFMKNMCMAGGFLQVVAYGAGAFSVDRK